jgi:dipeptidyl aminopeptidase/acylaminoacyl peptidase
MKIRPITAILSLHFISFSLWAQDGKIVETIPFTIADSIVQSLRRVDTGAGQIAHTVKFFHITYLSDGLRVKGYMALPKAEGTYPCVIFNRGGNRELGAITEGSFFRLLGRLAASGYIVVASQYRGVDGGEGKEEFGGQDIDDVLNMIPLLSSLPQADTSRIGMFGWSRGGMMTYLALTQTTRIKAAVVGSGMADLVRSAKERPGLARPWAQIIPGYATDQQAVLERRSAVNFTERICKSTPILIMQGTADWRVPPEQVLDLVNKLYKAKQPMHFILYEGGQHSLAEHRADYYAQLMAWFNKYLRDRERWPDLAPHGD